MSDQKITPIQVKRIHTIKGALKLTDLQYRAVLEMYHVFSSLQLTEQQADELIMYLESYGIKEGLWTRSYKKFQHLDGRKGMASARQLRMLEAMWAGVSRAGTQAARDASWKAFLCRWNISGMAEIEYWQVSKLVTALKAMQQEAR